LLIGRRDANFAWELSVPIYHPTTTLVMVVYGEAGRGKITFLGKLHYRISYLMYLNHRYDERFSSVSAMISIQYA
jgi:hypothetical protein